MTQAILNRFMEEKLFGLEVLYSRCDKVRQLNDGPLDFRYVLQKVAAVKIRGTQRSAKVQDIKAIIAAKCRRLAVSKSAGSGTEFYRKGFRSYAQ
jgi:hypothetical protein